MRCQQDLVRRTAEAMLQSNLCRWCQRCGNERPPGLIFGPCGTMALQFGRHAIDLGRDNLCLARNPARCTLRAIFNVLPTPRPWLRLACPKNVSRGNHAAKPPPGTPTSPSASASVRKKGHAIRDGPSVSTAETAALFFQPENRFLDSMTGLTGYTGGFTGCWS